MPADLERQVARQVLNKAVAAGEVVKPDTCQLCGSKPGRLNAHHEQYARPLDVLWLCMSCHARLHVSGSLAAYTDDLRTQLINAGRLLARWLADQERTTVRTEDH
jgi:hypothetical protein